MKYIYFRIISILLIITVFSLKQLFAQVEKREITGKNLSVTFEGAIGQGEYNILKITVSDIQKPAILVVTFYPLNENLFIGAEPSSLRDKYKIKGIPLVRKISTKGNYQLTFLPEIFNPVRWYGQGEPRFKEWVFDVILASEVFLERMPEGGVKKLGMPLILTTQDIEENFVLLTSFPQTSWRESMPSVGIYVVDSADGGFFTAIPNSSIYEKVQLLVPK